MATSRERPTSGRTSNLTVVAGQELRDLWIGGRGLLLTLGFSVLLSVVTYLVATNTALNYLEQRESVNLLLQVAIAVGALLCLLAGADTISGERERGTIEALLLTPDSPRRADGRQAARRALALGRRARRHDRPTSGSSAGESASSASRSLRASSWARCSRSSSRRSECS